MSPLRKQGSRAKNWIPASAGMTNTVFAIGTNWYLLRKTKIDNVTPAKAGIQGEKLDSRFWACCQSSK